MNDKQTELLIIMKEIHKFCVDNGIVYSLAYGTLLGAVRHKGFIPWDDDIDIYMERKDYERFLKEYKSKDTTASNYKTHPKKAMFTTRVFLNNSKFKEAVSQKFEYPEASFVDIFPLDNVPDNGYIKRKWYFFWCDFWDSMTYKKATHNFSSKKGKFIHHCLLIIAFFIPWKFAMWRMDKVTTKYNFKTNTYGLTTCRGDNGKHLIPKSEIKNVKLHKFEDTEFYIFKDYKNMLSDIYGNYMKLPPEDQRHGVHLVEK